MSGLNGSLCHGVWHEEEIELTIDDLGLLDESVVHIGALRGVEDAALVLVFLEESLSDALVDDDECHVREIVALASRVVFVS